MKDLVIQIANSCGSPTNDPLLDRLFSQYNEASPRDDSPVYYRFLYELARATKDNPLTMVELGCKYGAASLHFLKGGGKSSTGVDVTNMVDMSMFNGFDFTFKQCSSTDQSFANSIGLVDIVFIDTDHTYDLTAKEFPLWFPRVKPGGLILFDDILAKEYGCARFWRELVGNKLEYEHLHPVGWGFGIFFK